MVSTPAISPSNKNVVALQNHIILKLFEIYVTRHSQRSHNAPNMTWTVRFWHQFLKLTCLPFHHRCKINANSRTWTDTVLLPPDFKSGASTNFAILAWKLKVNNRYICRITALLSLVFVMCYYAKRVIKALPVTGCYVSAMLTYLDPHQKNSDKF